MANNTLLASDNFASGSLAAGWAAINGLSPCQVVSNQTKPNALSTSAGQTWTGGSIFGNDQTSEVTLGTGFVNEAGTLVSLVTRQQSGASTRYQADIGGSQAVISKIIAGTPSTLATIPGQTPAAGDVWVLQAAGSNIIVYKNNTFVGYAADAAISGGTPGYIQFSSVNIAHSTVASWRGYNCIQQDGIWKQQGIAIAPSTADLATFGAQNPTILLDTNPQILAGTQVLKMWFWADSTHLGYAESAANDGITWTRGSDVLTGNIVDPVVFKVGSTYHLYGINLGASPTTVFHYTSADGISWSAGTQVLSGTGSAWDAYLVFFTPFFIDGTGTWHAVYTGSVDSTGTKTFNLGHATSPDGITWTKDAANPVALNFYGLENLVKVGSTWYGWGESVNPGRGSSEAGVDPGDGVRLQTTDFVNWTNRISSLHHSQMFEGLNTLTGGVFPVGVILDVNGKAQLYSSVSVNDISGSHNQISVAIAPGPIASIITEPENALLQVSSDSFTSGTGDLSANWITPTGGTKLQIIAGNLCESTTAGVSDNQMIYTGSVFSNDQSSEITVKTLAASCVACPTVRGQPGSKGTYLAIITPSGPTSGIYKEVAGVKTQIGPLAGQTFVTGDRYRLTASGSSPVLLSLYQNDYLILQVEDWSNAWLSGSPGILLFASGSVANAQVSNWIAGSVNVIPFGDISGNAGVANALISFTGPFSGSTTADGSGNYTIIGAANGTYTLTPTLSGKTFTPTTLSVTVTNVNVPGQNFTASSGGSLVLAKNNIQITNSLLATNALLSPDLLGGTPDWS